MATHVAVARDSPSAPFGGAPALISFRVGGFLRLRSRVSAPVLGTAVSGIRVRLGAGRRRFLRCRLGGCVVRGTAAVSHWAALLVSAGRLVGFLARRFTLRRPVRIRFGCRAQDTSFLLVLVNRSRFASLATANLEVRLARTTVGSQICLVLSHWTTSAGTMVCDRGPRPRASCRPRRDARRAAIRCERRRPPRGASRRRS